MIVVICFLIMYYKNMIEDLIEIFIKEFQKYNMRGICVLGSWLSRFQNC